MNNPSTTGWLSCMENQPGIYSRASISTRKGFLLKIAFIFLFSFSMLTVKASHLVGGEISYTKVANGLNQYVIKLTLYRDCGGINLGNTAGIQLINSGVIQNVSLPLVGQVTDISLVCPGQFSNCQGGGNPGVQRFIYQATVTLSGNTANPTNVVYDVCCRPAGVNTLVNPGSQEMCVSTIIPAFNAGLNNNSPVFVNAPIAVFCQGQPATLALNAYDPDGDALQYFLVNARQSVGQNCTYVAGLSGTNPISAAVPASINLATGVINVTPNTVQRAVLAIRVDEYRAGVKIGEVFRDMEVTIKNCAGNTAPVVAPIANAVVQVGQTYCVPVQVSDAQAQNLTVTATGGIVPPATLTVVNSGPGFYNGTFCFTPSAIHAGNTFSISINANDNFCPVPSASVGTFNITVPAQCNVSVTASATPATCGLANGTATASMNGGVIPYGFNWTGPGGFISNNQNLSGLLAGTYSITIIDGNNCVESATVVVGNDGSNIVVNGIAADALCGQNNGSITINPAGGIAPYQYSLNGGAQQAANVFANLAPGTYTVVVSDANSCTNSASYIVNAAADVIPPTALCQNYTAYLDANGNANVGTGDIDNGSYDNCNSITLALSETSFDCSDIGANTVTLTVTDASLNVSSCTATVTVLDTVAPDLHCMNATLYLDASGEATLTTADVFDHEHEACTVDTLYVSKTLFTCADLGSNSVTLFGIDNSNNPGHCTATVTVLDTVKPVAVCQNFALNLAGGTGTVLPGDIDNGSDDNCAIVSMSVSPNTFTCDDAGDHMVTLTVTDQSGNSSSCTATVTVQYQPSCSITVIPENNIYTGGVLNNIYLGYGPQSATLQSSAAGGAGFTYSWAPATYLSCTNCANPVFTPSAAGTITYTLTVTNANGCVTECEVTMCVINAAATGKGNNGKVIICHVPPGNNNNPQTLSVAPNAVATHLTSHAGDQLGACGVSCGAARGANVTEGQLLENNGFETIVYPNPTSNEFTIVINSDTKGAIKASLYDMLGKKLIDMKDIEADVPYTVNQPLPSGMYFITIEHNGYVQNVRLIKQDN